MEQNEVIRIISDFIESSPENRLYPDKDEPAWEEALIGFCAGDDPIFETYKEHVGLFHWTPMEIFNLTYHDSPAKAEELTVISWVLPQREVTKADNRSQDFYPSERWTRARFTGEEFNELIRKHIVETLVKTNILAVAPTLSSEFKIEDSPGFGLASRWSERHAAHAAGLGTFGICDGLITPKGKAHRVGSVIARIQIPSTRRPYDNHFAYCLYFVDGSCMACAKRCPVNAISDKGHDKIKCLNHAGGTCAKYIKENFGFEGYGCGLCQTAVPCESGIPKDILKKKQYQQ